MHGLRVLPSAFGIIVRASLTGSRGHERKIGREGGGKFVTNSFVSSTPQNEQLERKRFQTATRRWWAAESHGEPRRDEEREQRGRSRLRNLFCSHVCSLRESRKPGTPMQADPCTCKIRDCVRARVRGNIRFYFRNLWLSINFKSVPSGALRAGKAGQTESSRRERARFPLSLFRHLFLSFFLFIHLASFFLLRFSSFLLSSFLIYNSFIYPLPATSFPSSSSLPIYAIPGSYGDSGLAVNCVWCNPRGFYNRDFHPFFLPPGLSTGRPSTPFSPSSLDSSSSSTSPTKRDSSLPAFHSFSFSSFSVFFTPVLLLSRRLIVRDWFSNRFLTAPFFAD